MARAIKVGREAALVPEAAPVAKRRSVPCGAGVVPRAGALRGGATRRGGTDGAVARGPSSADATWVGISAPGVSVTAVAGAFRFGRVAGGTGGRDTLTVV